jgi:hypothetical protein
MSEALICDPIRTAIGRYAGGLATVRPDDLGAVPIKALMERNTGVDWERVDDVYYGNANQAGEDNRNVARMSSLLAGLPLSVPGSTINRLCGSGMDAVGMAARAVKSGETGLMIAGGVESMSSRAPLVMPKADAAFSRRAEIFDTTIGWRFVNRLMQDNYGIDSMPETAENVAEQFNISRQDQDAFALRSQLRAERVCAAFAAARRTSAGGRRFRRGDRAGADPAAPGRSDRIQGRRTSARRQHAASAGEAADAVSRRRQRHRGQRLGRRQWRPRASSRASWASGRRPRAARCWRWPDCRCSRWTSSNSTKPSPRRRSR